MIPVRQSTAFECSIGPVLDASGVAVTDCVVGDFKIKKTTSNFAALNASATLTHVSAGTYDLVLTTSDTDTVGLCSVAIDDTTNACAPLYLQVMEEAIYDALYAASANALTGAAGSTKVTEVATLTGHTAQTGDSFARLTGTGAVTFASLTVSGATTLTGAVSLGSTLGVTGAITATNASNNLRINGVAPGASGGLMIAGTNAATTFASITSTGALSIGDGIIVSTITTDRNALTLTGNNDGHGVRFNAGAGLNAAAISIASGAGKGIDMTAATVGITISSGGDAVDITTSSGHGIDLSGIAGASKYGIKGTIDGAITNSGLSTHSATDVWAAGTRTLTALDEDTTTIDLNATIQAAVGLASANLDTQLDALPTAAENAAALMDLSDGIEIGLTPRNAMKLIAAASAGKLSGAATTSVVIRNAVADSKNRITATVDADGNRSAVTLDLT